MPETRCMKSSSFVILWELSFCLPPSLPASFNFYPVSLSVLSIERSKWRILSESGSVMRSKLCLVKITVTVGQWVLWFCQEQKQLERKGGGVLILVGMGSGLDKVVKWSLLNEGRCWAWCFSTWHVRQEVNLLLIEMGKAWGNQSPVYWGRDVPKKFKRLKGRCLVTPYQERIYKMGTLEAWCVCI